jgi:serine/threonine-protein kinase
MQNAIEGETMYQAGDIIALTASAWRLRAPLAASSYGVLWQAESCNGGAPAALKLVNVEQMTLALPPQRACWTRCAALETGILRSLQPWDRRHIVALLDSGEHLGQPALALELLDGDLARHLDALACRGVSVGFGQALDWIAQVNGALAKLHQYGWRHLDLKPSNLLLGDGGAMLKLADFGTSRALAEHAPHAYSGTASWQAPEQFFPHDGQHGAYRTDARADYFALGALFYRLVTGSLLRYAETCAAAYREHGSDGAARLRAQHGGALPPVLEAEEAALFMDHALRHANPQGTASAAAAEAALALLRTLLAPRPEGRPRHALDISRLLARVRAGLACAQQPMRSAA